MKFFTKKKKDIFLSLTDCGYFCLMKMHTVNFVKLYLETDRVTFHFALQAHFVNMIQLGWGLFWQGVCACYTSVYYTSISMLLLMDAMFPKLYILLSYQYVVTVL